ncbi:MAG: dihydroorotate dehydrogenase B catalytic subunit [Candidatus Chisholmbacteria bacterium RIFCSPHIGHO2_01_FULL_48_12]|uniref:Dihydroorotate dehydrogenase n=1 Tax=Candidatus Chisholmbacteria bacterium RIFCSPHIGHO2_01_FULL_48_12 TaxID=1797589 RepID=A0A1G1VP69_9BACT|nr:MAG: dihydroorotate dehydrogenase B catalytic subunit [Candidatus Chisholmbacteria bacterium RIFCSPHIGHO2_01_FULL_48_12]
MAPPPSLSINLAGVQLVNPLVLASGFLGTDPHLLARVAHAPIGAITTKSCCLNPRQGHENPTVLAWDHGLINAVGLTNPGVNHEVQDIIALKQLLNQSPVRIIASFFGGTVTEFVQVAQILSTAKPDFLEANLSCPNTEADLGRPFAIDPKVTYQVVKQIKQVTSVPLIVKLSPNVTDIQTIALAAQSAGADILCAINAVTGLLIDPESGQPILTNTIGGLSGPAIKPIALKCVYQISQACKLPLIGLGGVSSGADAATMIMAGATAVGVGTAIYYRGLRAFTKITQELNQFMTHHHYKSLTDFKGLAHDQN